MDPAFESRRANARRCPIRRQQAPHRSIVLDSDTRQHQSLLTRPPFGPVRSGATRAKSPPQRVGATDRQEMGKGRVMKPITMTASSRNLPNAAKKLRKNRSARIARNEKSESAVKPTRSGRAHFLGGIHFPTVRRVRRRSSLFWISRGLAFGSVRGPHPPAS